MKKGILITGGLVTAFLVSFSASAYFMMNAKDLVFAKDKKEVSELSQQLEEKEMEIVDLKEQVERYQTLYATAISGSGGGLTGADGDDDEQKPTKKPAKTQSPTREPSSTRASVSTGKPMETDRPSGTITPTKAPTKAPTKTPERSEGPEMTKKPAAPDESNTSADD